METKNPTVAVVMCTYNGEKYLREQMDSILAQTYPIHEIIVQDDRSTDGTVALLRQYAARVPQMRVYVNGRNLGFNRNFHTACLRATADLTWPCRTAWHRSCCARACPPCCACAACACATAPPCYPPTSTRPRLARRHQGLLLPLHLRMALLVV